MMRYRILRFIAALAVMFASLPLMAWAMEHGFGLGAMLTVPTCCLGFWFALVSQHREQRIGWLAFSSTNVLLLPWCPWWQRMIEAVLNWAQDILRGSQPTPLYHYAEIVALLAMLVLPWGLGCGLGMLADRLARTYISASTNDDATQPSYRFTVRGMLLVIMVVAFLTGSLSTTVRRWDAHEKTNQELLLQRFNRSFTTGNVTLLGEPMISENHAVLKGSQNATGISEYRIVAPIQKDGIRLWAVWAYVCHDSGGIFRFGYAETVMLNGLPPNLFCQAEYLRESTYRMVDGEPPLSIQATIVEAPAVARSGDSIRIIAVTERIMECDLLIHPYQAALSQPRRVIAPESGVVSWDVALDPAYVGSHLTYEFQSRINQLYRAKTVTGEVALLRDRGEPSEPK